MFLAPLAPEPCGHQNRPTAEGQQVARLMAWERGGSVSSSRSTDYSDRPPPPFHHHWGQTLTEVSTLRPVPPSSKSSPALHIPGCPLQPSQHPAPYSLTPSSPTHPLPHLLGDYHVIPDHRQPGRSRGRFITIQRWLSSCRRAAGLMLVARVGSGEGPPGAVGVVGRGSADLQPKAAANCLKCVKHV